MNTILKNKR